MVFYELWFLADFSIVNVKQSLTQQFIKHSLYLKVTLILLGIRFICEPFQLKY